MRVVLDTSVLVAAFRSQTGASNRVLQLAMEGSFEVAASNPVFLEYEQVLTREHQLAAHGIPIDEINRFLIVLANRIVPYTSISFGGHNCEIGTTKSSLKPP